jgi:hypothetical protein
MDSEIPIFEAANTKSLTPVDPAWSYTETNLQVKLFL